MTSPIPLAGFCVVALMWVVPLLEPAHAQGREAPALDMDAAMSTDVATAGGTTRFDCLLTLIDDLATCRREHCETQSLFWFTWEVCDQLAVVGCAQEADERFQDCLKAATS